MDDPAVPRDELASALAYIRWVNRRLGGCAALVTQLNRWSQAWPPGATISLLDVATGSADVPITAARWARSRGFTLRVVGIDLHETTLAVAAEQVAAAPDVAGQIELRRLDALDIRHSFSCDAFDYVHAGLFLHHLSDVQILTVLAAMDRVAARGVIWNDLIRSSLATLGVHLLTIGTPPMVKHDARVSVAAGFTRAEALDLARRADWTAPEWHARLWGQRFTVTSTKRG